MANILADQIELHGRIVRIVENFKKKGKANINTTTIRARIKVLDDAWEEFKTAHRELQRSTPPEARKSEYFTMDYYEKTQEAYIEQLGYLMKLLEEEEGGANTSDKVSQAATQSETRSRAVLPRIGLPIFDGDCRRWPAFRDMYQSLIMTDTSLSDVERFHYLKDCLKSEAAALIRNIATTERNFQRAWRMLEDRYQNERVIVSAHLEAFVKIPTMRKESSSELKQLLYGTCEALEALAALERPCYDCDLIVHITVGRLDRQSRREWEASLGNSTKPPTFKSLKEFLEMRLRAVEALEEQRGELVHEVKKPATKPARVLQVTAGAKKKLRCGICQGDHRLLFCARYNAKTPAERSEVVTSLNHCHNCLGKHLISSCPSAKRCQRCTEKHHTSLHPVSSDHTPSTVLHTYQLMQERGRVLFGTALVKAVAANGQAVFVRALIDSGSEESLISEHLTQMLGLKRHKADIPLLGISGRTRRTRGLVHLYVQPHHTTSPQYPVSALVLPHLSEYKPPSIKFDDCHKFKGLTLADPCYSTNQKVELILGVDFYGTALRSGVRRCNRLGVTAQNTGLGWLFMGRLPGKSAEKGSQEPTISLHCSVDRQLSEWVEKFWKQEEVEKTKILNQEERECEEFFKDTHRRNSEGRFVVRLHFKSTPILGDTKLSAASMLTKMERKFRLDSEFHTEYREFMKEYERLGHMNSAGTAKGCVFLPHHGVLKESSTTTKLRVVFNGSWTTSTGKSLNDFLHAGENLLPSLADVLTRWRRHRISFTADVEKMYRQIFIHPEDRDYQRVLWRSTNKEPIREYRLNTVTYGLTCAPFLANRCLLQLAIDGALQLPLGARKIREDIYVDDVLSGAPTVEEARAVKEELTTLLMAGGFRLRKWACNTPGLLEPEDNCVATTPLHWESDSSHSVLGIQWNPLEDLFTVHVREVNLKGRLSKRSILSTVSRIFDPLGWLSPVTVWAKGFLQDLWLLKIDWDDPLPHNEEQNWRSFIEDLPALNSLRVTRWLGMSPDDRQTQLHGFADASERAYAAVVYVRTINVEGLSLLHLVTAKTKVAPLKKVSLPRLELCAAQLTARLTAHVQEVLHLQNSEVHLWSDSTVTLAWIQGHPTRWKTYIANRVAEIQRLLPEAKWHHISGTQNPADCASRGLRPMEFINMASWWLTPSWLVRMDEKSSNPVHPLDQLDDEAILNLHTQVQLEETVSSFIEQFSTFKRLIRVTAWCCRWLRPQHTPREAYLTASELRDARDRWLRLVQAEAFPTELKALRNQEPLPSKSRIRRLSPWLDGDGILRVGGRLRNSSLNNNMKHPRILPQGSPLTVLLVKDAHERCLHGGTQLTLATLRLSYWILRGRQSVKGCIRNCIICLRWRNNVSTQRMGNLPSERITPCRAFNKVDLDYAGPIQLRTTRGRGHHSYKGYVCLFVCLATRAVHLEVVSDGSTNAFMAALNRFVARRGICSEIWSDCGTAFIGADRELRALLPDISQETSQLLTLTAVKGIQWRFNPPGGPHFGGIWEAAVKSAKHHLRRVVGETTLTYEEMATLLAGIEACMNSRPLQPLSDDPDDLEVLTPGHFLIGEPIIAAPEANIEEVPISRLSRWQLVTQMRQHFWRRWSREYLNTLQSRGKWQEIQANVKIGDLCLLRNELLPPTRWPLARVIQVHPGTDGLVRVVTLKTAKSHFKRPITKIVLLPSVNTDEGSSTGAACP